jgi:hypothetical protein
MALMSLPPDARQALYRENGTWFHLLDEFPGALFDANGYILFETQQDYERCEFLQKGKELGVPNGIESIPGYVRITAAANREPGTGSPDLDATQPTSIPTNVPFVFSPSPWSDRASSTVATSAQMQLDVVLRHNEMQKTLHDRLVSQYGDSNVSFENNSGVGARVDVIVRRGNEYWFYEIKTAQSPRACVKPLANCSNMLSGRVRPR